MDTVESYTAVQYVPACSVAVPPAETLKTRRRRRRRRSIRSIYPVIGIEVNRPDQKAGGGQRWRSKLPTIITLCSLHHHSMYRLHVPTTSSPQTDSSQSHRRNRRGNHMLIPAAACRCPQLHHNGRMVILPSRHAPATRYKHGPACTGRPCLYLALNEG